MNDRPPVASGASRRESGEPAQAEPVENAHATPSAERDSLDESRRAALAELERGTQEVLTRNDLIRKLARGMPLKVKAGFDPTAPDLHIGHTVLLNKMRQFQQLGHEVIFLIGDFTGLIGDPTGRNATRPPLTREQLNANAETYKAQVFKILDESKTEIRFNSERLAALGFEGMIPLTAIFTVSQMLELEDFHKRFQEEKPISV